MRAFLLLKPGELARFVEIEGAHVGFWLSTYGTEAPEVQRLQEALEARIDAALGAA